MKRLISTFALFTCLAFLQAAGASANEATELYTSMRKQVLELDGKQIPGFKGKPVWAVLMETGSEDTVISVVAVADGTASLYYSTGGGMIGLGKNPGVRSATLAFVKKSASFLKFMKRVDVFPLPKTGQTFFYLVTPKAVFSYEAQRDDLGRQQDKLSPLYYAGHELIAQVRIADQKRKGR
ncbi:MAG: hypothetical protein QM496_05085 [Verrucomicrobiota bacterium]